MSGVKAYEPALLGGSRRRKRMTKRKMSKRKSRKSRKSRKMKKRGGAPFVASSSPRAM